MDNCFSVNRANFPTGLLQPPNSYRFGEEALLLAALAAKLRILKGEQKIGTVVEAGCGCGAALLGLLLLFPTLSGLGLDREPELLDCARENARMLACADRTEFLPLDFADCKLGANLPRGVFDLAIANPPWHTPRSGRQSESGMRNRALRGGNFSSFFRVCAYLLRHRGFFCLILPAAALAPLFANSETFSLGVRCVLPLRTSARQPSCERIFVVCQKDAKSDCKILRPLTVRARKKIFQEPVNWPARIFKFWQEEI